MANVDIRNQNLLSKQWDERLKRQNSPGAGSIFMNDRRIKQSHLCAVGNAVWVLPENAVKLLESVGIGRKVEIKDCEQTDMGLRLKRKPQA